MSGPPVARVGPTDRAALAAVAAQFWINGMVYASIIPRLPELRDRLGVDVALLGFVLTVSAGGGLIGSAVAAPAIARLGTRRVIVAGTVLSVAILPIIGLSGSLMVVAAALVALALLDVMIDIGMNLQGSWLSARRATPVMNRLHGLWSVGTVVGGLVAVRAASAGTALWLHLVVVAVGLAAVLAISGRFLLPADESSTGPDLDTGAVARTVDAATTFRSVALLGLLGAAAVTMEMTTADWAAFRLADDLAVAPGRVGLGFVAFTSGMVAGRFLGDAVQSRLGARRLVRLAATMAAVGIAVASLLPAGDGSTLVPLVRSLVGFFVAALGVSVVFPQLYDAAAQAPGPAGRGLGALTAGTRLASLTTPVVVGLLADSRLSVGTAVALVTLPACALVVVRPRPDLR